MNVLFLLLALLSAVFVVYGISAFALSSEQAGSAHAASPELEMKVEASAKL